MKKSKPIPQDKRYTVEKNLKESPDKLDLEPDDIFVGTYRGKQTAKSSREDQKDFDMFKFDGHYLNDADLQGLYYLTGAGLADVDFVEGGTYRIVYHGTVKTREGNNAKRYSVAKVTLN